MMLGTALLLGLSQPTNQMFGPLPLQPRGMTHVRPLGSGATQQKRGSNRCGGGQLRPSWAVALPQLGAVIGGDPEVDAKRMKNRRSYT